MEGNRPDFGIENGVPGPAILSSRMPDAAGIHEPQPVAPLPEANRGARVSAHRALLGDLDRVRPVGMPRETDADAGLGRPQASGLLQEVGRSVEAHHRIPEC